MKSESLFQYLDDLFDVEEHPDYGTALNGLQVEGPSEIAAIACAVDASEETIAMAARAGADLLLVHHGLFWSGLRPLTGRRFRKVRALIEGGTALYSMHLPLDAHPDLGNCALLAREIGMEPDARFARYDGAPIGWAGSFAGSRDALVRAVEEAVAGPVQLLDGGPERIERVGVVTGSGGSFLEDAADAGLDALVTGEGSHNSYVDAMELGVNVLYGGHYATETFGVRALSEHLADRFGLRWTFLDAPSGL